MLLCLGLLLASLSFAQGVTPAAPREGAPTAAGITSQAGNYACDPSLCRPPACLCASTSPPGGLTPAQTPMFITFTADDALEVFTTNAVSSFLSKRTNPNGCSAKMTWFVSLQWGNYSMITDWYNAGHEIADHTMTHVGIPPENEIVGNLAALNAFSRIPLGQIKGFRAPFLSFSPETLKILANSGFEYDSSSTSSSYNSEGGGGDRWWPYTLDHGLANNCIDVPALCSADVRVPGLWEVPLYATFDSSTTPPGIHLMDPWLDTEDPEAALTWLKNTFLERYRGNRVPFGIYTHPIHLATGYPGLTDPVAMIDVLNSFLDWAQAFPDVWILLEWIKAPVPSDQMDTSAAVQCKAPKVDASLRFCNGMKGNEEGLLCNCNFPDFAWTTCYGCPVVQPTPDNPVPRQNVSALLYSPNGLGVTPAGSRTHVPVSCATAFWDPVKGTCMCTGADCAWTDLTRPIGNYTPQGTTDPSTATTSSSSSATSSSSASTRPSSRSSAGGSRARLEEVAMWATVAAAALLM